MWWGVGPSAAVVGQQGLSCGCASGSCPVVEDACVAPRCRRCHRCRQRLANRRHTGCALPLQLQAKRAAWDQWSATVSWPARTMQATKVGCCHLPAHLLGGVAESSMAHGVHCTLCPLEEQFVALPRCACCASWPPCPQDAAGATADAVGSAASAAAGAASGAAQYAAGTAGWAADKARDSWYATLASAYANWYATKDKSKQVRGCRRYTRGCTACAASMHCCFLDMCWSAALALLARAALSQPLLACCQTQCLS